jgi:hypothetical protein
VWADGSALVQLDRVTLLPPEQIVDNPQASFTGSWGTATKLAGYYVRIPVQAGT